MNEPWLPLQIGQFCTREERKRILERERARKRENAEKAAEARAAAATGDQVRALTENIDWYNHLDFWSINEVLD